MKYRDYKEFAPGNYYHVYNRGNGRQEVFLEEQDYSFFLRRLKENIVPEKVPFSLRRAPSPGGYIRKQLPPQVFTLICYCLMPNHFHLLIRQNAELPLSKLVLKVCTSYSKYFNRKYDRVGHLFQDQYKSVLVEIDSQLLWLSAYIHQNPKVAGLVGDLKDYPWSSYLDYVGQRGGTLCNKEVVLNQFKSPDDYRTFVEQSYDSIKHRKEVEKLLLDEEK